MRHSLSPASRRSREPLAHYGDGDPWAVLVYAGVVATTGLMLLLTVVTAQRQALAEPAPGVAERRQALVVVVWPTAVFLLSIPLALVHPLGAMLLWTLAALGPLVRRLLDRA